jgi:hypothetical protein
MLAALLLAFAAPSAFALKDAPSLRPGAGPLDYKPVPFEASVSTESENEYGRTLTVTFPSPVTSPFKRNDTVWGHLVLPRSPGPHAAILVLPVMAAPNVWIETQFIKRFQKDGFAVLWLEMPYQFHRRPLPSEPSGQVFLARTAKHLAANFRQSVLDARRALWWLSRRPEVDKDKIGVFGISLGSIVGSTVYSVDQTPKYGVFMLGGADFPTLIVSSSLTGPWMKRIGIKPESVRDAWKGIDPVNFKELNRGKKALLINCRSDTVIPTANAMRLKDAFPDAKQEWLPLGHYTAILHLIWIPKYVSRVFAEHLGAPAP